MTLPLDGVLVLDFSTLLPGPLASLMLAEAGAEVIKIERPVVGDEMRTYEPQFGVASANFALLNRGKKSIAVDLKSDGAQARIRPLVERADVLIEQFRPGVMERLGCGYEQLRALNRRLVYCSITGYGQSGPRANTAGHDLNYMAESGLLSLVRDSAGTPALPPALIADIAGGAYPAVTNILLALRQREATGRGVHLDVAMFENLFTFEYWAFSQGYAGGHWPTAGTSLVTGGSPRYNIYRTSDDRFVAAAPLEDRFWAQFCNAIELEAVYRDDRRDPGATRAAVAASIRSRSAQEWTRRFAGKDVCCSVVASVEEAVGSEQVRARDLLARRVTAGSMAMPALPVPIAPPLRRPEVDLPYPALAGADDAG